MSQNQTKSLRGEAFWKRLASRIWFLPAVLLVASTFIAALLLTLDRTLEEYGQWMPVWLATTGTSARLTLSAIIGGLITTTGLVLSMTMLAVAQTTSQYGPRLVRSVLSHGIVQWTIGMFLATTVFAIVIMRSIREFGEDGTLFVPQISILIAEIASSICLILLLALINHVNRSLRAENLVRNVANDLNQSIQRYLSECNNLRFDEGASLEPNDFEQSPVRVESSRSGYIQSIDYARLVRLASEHDTRSYVPVRPGDFIFKGETICRIDREPDSVERWEASFVLGDERSPVQDVECSIMELVEVAVRALSPGINDPFTAMNVLDYLGNSLRIASEGEAPKAVLQDEQGNPRVQRRVFTFEGMVNAAFNQIRQYGSDSVPVACRMLETLGALHRVARNEHQRTIICRHIGLVADDAFRNIEQESDRNDVEYRQQRALAAAEL